MEEISRILMLAQNEPAITVLSFFVLFLLVMVLWLTFRMKNLTKGGDGKSLEGTIKTLGSRTSALESYARKNQQTISNMETRLARAVQGVATERFDPFRNAGGQQSFTTAFVNEHGNGVIVSGIHSRDQVRVYAKPIINFSSEHELSDEEKTAVARAKKDMITK